MRALTALVIVGTLDACKLAGDEACAVRAVDPLVTVEVVTDSASNAAIPAILISDVLYSGLQVSAGTLVDPQRAPVRQATVEGDAVRCVVVCGFGSNEGTYRVTIAAPGYSPRTVSFAAAYNSLGDGCPRLQRQGVKLNLSLTKL